MENSIWSIILASTVISSISNNIIIWIKEYCYERKKKNEDKKSSMLLLANSLDYFAIECAENIFEVEEELKNIFKEYPSGLGKFHAVLPEIGYDSFGVNEDFKVITKLLDIKNRIKVANKSMKVCIELGEEIAMAEYIRQATMLGYEAKQISNYIKKRFFNKKDNINNMDKYDCYNPYDDILLPNYEKLFNNEKNKNGTV